MVNGIFSLKPNSSLFIITLPDKLNHIFENVSQQGFQGR